MTPKNFTEANKLYTKPKEWKDEECGNLPTFEVRTNDDDLNVKVERIISCWQPSPEEIEDIKNGKPVWLHIWYPVQMPVLLSTEFPFVNPSEN